MKENLSRPPYRGNMKVKGPKIPGVDDFRAPDKAHQGGYDRVSGNEISDYSEVMPPGNNAMKEVRRYNSKKRRGRFNAIEAAHALAMRMGGGKGKGNSLSPKDHAFFKSIGIVDCPKA